MCLYGNVYSRCVDVRGGQKNSELGLQAIMNQPVGILRTEPKSSASAASTPQVYREQNCRQSEQLRPVSPTPGRHCSWSRSSLQMLFGENPGRELVAQEHQNKIYSDCLWDAVWIFLSQILKK